MRIDSGHFLLGDVVHESPVIVRMGGRGLGERFGGCIGDEQLLAGNANALPPVLPRDFRRMRLQPRRIPVELLALGACTGQFMRVSDLFHHNLRRLTAHSSPLQLSGVFALLYTHF
jgi:hypothetical protein